MRFERGQNFTICHFDKGYLEAYTDSIIKETDINDLSVISKEMIVISRIKIDIASKYIKEFGTSGDIDNIRFNIFERTESLIISHNATGFGGVIIG